MTVSTTATYVRLAGNASANTIATTFPVFDEDDLQVTSIVDATGVPTTLALTSGYTVAIDSITRIATVTLVTTPASGITIDVRSNTVLVQPESIRNLGRYLPEVHENALDRMERQIQDIDRRLQLALRLPDNLIPGNALLSPLSAWFNKLLGFSATGVPEPTLVTNTALSQSVIGGLLNPQTGAEDSAGVVPTNYSYQNSPRINAERYGLDLTGVTSGVSALNKCVQVLQAVGSLGGIVEIGPGTVLLDSALDFDDSYLLTFEGSGGFNVGGHNNGTVFKYTGTGSDSIISARSSFGFKLKNINVQWTSASFTGYAVDFSHSVAANDSAFMHIEGCRFGSTTGLLTNGNCINLDKAINGRIVGNGFDGCDVAIQGQAMAGGSYSNQHVISNSQFVLTSSVPIQGLGEAWTVKENVFEQRATGIAGAIYTTVNTPVSACVVTGNWCGDATAGISTWFTFWGGASKGGVVFSGNWMYGAYYSAAVHGTGVSLNNIQGFHSSGNVFLGLTNAYDFGTATVSGFVDEPSNVVGGSGADVVTNRYSNAANCNSFSQAAGQGATILPNGFRMECGNLSVTAGSPVAVTFSRAFTTLYSITTTLGIPASAANTAYVGSPTTSGFNATVNGTGGANTVYWTAIGL